LMVRLTSISPDCLTCLEQRTHQTILILGRPCPAAPNLSA
jgi:hypothetical protein